MQPYVIIDKPQNENGWDQDTKFWKCNTVTLYPSVVNIYKHMVADVPRQVSLRRFPESNVLSYYVIIIFIYNYT